MWGDNGKNNPWPMGNHWLVALLVFQATLAFADFGNNDSQNLADCKSYLYTIMGDVHQLGLGGISTDVYLILQELGYMDDSLNEIEQDIDQISRQIVKIGDAVLTPTTTQIKNQIAVTNIAETYWLQKISGQLDIISGGGISMLTPFGYEKVWSVDNYWLDYMQRIERGDFINAIHYSGLWGLFPMLLLDVIDYNHVDSSESDILNFLQYQLGMSAANARRFLRYMKSDGGIGPTFQNQYGTLILQNMATNTFFSGLDVNNFFTNGVALSLYATNAFHQVADSSGINTNEMFLGDYGSSTNSDVFADIVTNGVDQLDINKSYAVMADDVSASSLSNKVSMFDFTSKFDDSIKPFLDEIETFQGGDWIINFGNVDLGDHFSFTIPALTLERNETFLRYVDKFLNLIKIMLTFGFFLMLWHQLGHAVEST